MVSMGGCFVSCISKRDLLSQICSWIESRECGRYVAAVNVSKIVLLQKDRKLASFMASSSINIADGSPVYYAARLLGSSTIERITGIELMEDLLRLAGQRGFRVFFFGSKQKVLDVVLEKCRRLYPGLTIAGARNGYYTPEEEQIIVREIAASNVDILLVALGLPQKEYFVHDHVRELRCPLILPVGGGFDVFAGIKRRAPRWVQKIGVEWLWRSMYDMSRAKLVKDGFVPFLKIIGRDLYQKGLLKRG
mgnify:CR=1 FL=1